MTTRYFVEFKNCANTCLVGLENDGEFEAEDLPHAKRLFDVKIQKYHRLPNNVAIVHSPSEGFYLIENPNTDEERMVKYDVDASKYWTAELYAWCDDSDEADATGYGCLTRLSPD